MKTIQKIMVCLILGFIVLNYGCKKDDPVGCNYATELQAESDALTVAATAYSSNPTPANCQAFKNAYESYLDEAENYVDCATISGQGAELQAAIDAARVSLDSLSC